MLFTHVKWIIREVWMRAVLGHPWLVFFLFLVATALAGYHIPRLRFQSSIYDLAVKDLPETIHYEDFKRVFGSEEVILVVARTKGVFEKDTFQALGKLAGRLGSIEGVRRVISLPGIRRDMDLSGKWGLEEFERVLEPVDLIRKSLLSEDRKNTAIMLLLRDVQDKGKIVEEVERLISGPRAEFSLYQTGMPVVSEALARFTRQDFLRLPPLTFALIALLLFLFFRSARGVLIPLGVVLMVLVWIFGWMGFAGTPLSMLTMIVPVFLIAVGTAYCMHVWSAYLEALQVTDSGKEAVLKSFSRSALPTVLVVATTVISVGSLFVNRIGGIRAFAVFACLGMISLLAVMLIFLPSLLVLLPSPKKRFSALTTRPLVVDGFLRGVIRLNLAHQKVTLPVLGAVIVMSVWGMFRIRVETNPVAYFREESPISRRFHDIYRDMSGSFPVNVVVSSGTDSSFEDPGRLRQLQEIQGRLESLAGVDKSMSFLDYLKLVNYATNRFDPRYYALPEEPFEVRMLVNSYKTMLGSDMLQSFMNEDFDKANILLLTHLSSSRDFLRLRSKIAAQLGDALTATSSPRYEITGFGMVISASSDLVTRGQIASLLITLTVVLGMMLVLFLSFKVGFIAILANFFPIIVSFGCMGWLGIELSMVTSLIASIAIGLAVDDTIHYLVGFSREIRKDLNKQRALTDTMLRVGRPMVYTTFTIGSGFAVLLFSHFEPTAVFGMMMAVALVAALAGDLILLPSLMMHVELVTVWDLLKLMRPLGGVASGIAHELNQPLNAIKMGSEFLKMELEEGRDIPREHLSQVVTEIDAQVDRASAMIKRLRQFDQKADVEWEQVELNGIIHDVMAIVGQQLAVENIEISLELEPGLPTMPANPNRVGQVVYNLLSNAREAILRRRELERRDCEARVVLRTFTLGRRELGLEVSDTGIGIPEEERSRVFEPFYTVKRGGGGLGLGLSIVYGIVKEYGGRIQIESEEGRGSTFRVVFPRPKV